MNKEKLLSYYKDKNEESKIKPETKIMGVFSTNEEKCNRFFNNLYKDFKAKNIIKISNIGADFYINNDNKKVLWLTNGDRYIWYNPTYESIKGARVTDAYVDEDIINNYYINLILHVTTYCSGKDIKFF